MLQWQRRAGGYLSGESCAGSLVNDDSSEDDSVTWQAATTRARGRTAIPPSTPRGPMWEIRYPATAALVSMPTACTTRSCDHHHSRTFAMHIPATINPVIQVMRDDVSHSCESSL